MSGQGWLLSAFGDEVSDDLLEQIAILRSLQIGYLELRGVWGKNVLHLQDDEVATLARECAKQGMYISAIGSPVGKTPITQPLEVELTNLRRIFAIANGLGDVMCTRLVRVFSFYPPEANEVAWEEDALVAESITRLNALTELAQAEGFQLVLENESGIVGDTVARCKRLLEGVPSPALAFAWDPANFVHVGEQRSVIDGWDALGKRTRHVHIKDYRLATDQVTGEVLPAGEGEGQIDLLLPRLAESGYGGFLALEPHLAFAGQSSGFSGADGMARAANALRSLLASLGLHEQQAVGI